MTTVKDAGVHGNKFIFPAPFLDFATLVGLYVFWKTNYAGVRWGGSTLQRKGSLLGVLDHNLHVYKKYEGNV